MKKKVVNGAYTINGGAGEIRFSAEKDDYPKMFTMDGQQLPIADTLDSKVVWSRYKKRR